MKKITLAEIKKEIRKALREAGYEPSPNRPKREPGIAEPPTKPEKNPKRRTLTPPKEAPQTKPKAEGKIKKGEKNILNKIVNRYKKFK